MSPTSWTRAQVAARIDHTLLRPEATKADLALHLDQARELGVYAVCVWPSLIPRYHISPLKLATVCGFPSGKHRTQIKVAEAAQAAADGADELDMVIDIGSTIAGDWGRVSRQIEAVREAFPPPGVLKVITESAALTDAQLVEVCRRAQAAGADYVKTSTGFHPAGGASLHAVQVMADTIGGQLGIKASGGIRTGAEAIALLNAGATRIGASATAQILADLPDQ